MESNKINANTNYLALVGLPRTGTSIFLRALNRNNDFFILYESIISPFLTFKNKNVINAYFYELIKQFIHQSKDSNKKQSFSQEYKFFGDKIIYSSSRIINFLLKRALAKRIDKTIFIIRDPRATYFSYKKWIDKRNEIYTNSDHVSHTTINQQMKKWNEYINFISKYKNNESKVLIVKYEDLATNELQEMNRINKFLEYSPSIEEQKIMHDSSLSSWEKELSQEEIKIINELTTSGRAMFNYH